MQFKTFNFKLYFLLLLTFQSIFSQEVQHNSNKNLFTAHVYSSASRLPIANATIKTSSKNELRYFITDTEGKFEMPNYYKKEIDYIEISSLGFKKVVLDIILDSIYLENDVNELDEVFINSKSKITYQLSAFEKFNTFETNFSWDNKAAVYIPSNGEHKEIKKLLFAVSDYGGVKNLKYLPFKVNIYTVDSFGLPDKPILSQDIEIKKEDDKNWTKVDISKSKIIIPAQGIFVVFIILDKKDYKVNYINSKHGLISAVPGLKAYKYSKTYVRKSYIYRECNYPELCNVWLIQNLHYMMDVEF